MYFIFLKKPCRNFYNLIVVYLIWHHPCPSCYCCCWWFCFGYCCSCCWCCYCCLLLAAQPLAPYQCPRSSLCSCAVDLKHLCSVSECRSRLSSFLRSLCHPPVYLHSYLSPGSEIKQQVFSKKYIAYNVDIMFQLMMPFSVFHVKSIQSFKTLMDFLLRVLLIVILFHWCPMRALLALSIKHTMISCISVFTQSWHSFSYLHTRFIIRIIKFSQNKSTDF